MIQAGTIRTGSACTSGVVGEYWISSMSSLRKMTWPSVTATFSPTRKSSVPGVVAAMQRALHVVEEILVAAREILAALGDGLLQHFGIRHRVVGGRERLGRLSSGELHELGISRLDARHIARGLFHERQAVLEGLCPDIERILLPGRIREPAVAVVGRRDAACLARPPR